jgi:hypothetical protein
VEAHKVQVGGFFLDIRSGFDRLKAWTSVKCT